MNAPAVIRQRESCLVERAYACAAGFDRLGKSFSADITRNMARELELGGPGALYEHWIGAQEARLAGMMS